MKRPTLSRSSWAIVAVLVPLALLLAYVALRSGPLAPVAVTLTRVEQRALRPALFGVGSVEARYACYRIGPTAPGRLLRLGSRWATRCAPASCSARWTRSMPTTGCVHSRPRCSAARRCWPRLRRAMAHAQAQARRYEQLFAERVVTEELLAARRQDLQLTLAALTPCRRSRPARSPTCRRCAHSAAACA
jgi:HlyD family secretion protein